MAGPSMQIQLGAGKDKPEPLPAMRAELELFPGPRTGSGAPTWTIRDPLADRYFRIGWLEFEILAHWRPGQPPDAVLAALRDRPLLQVDEKDILSVADFLRSNALTAVDGEKDTERLVSRMRAQQKGPLNWLLKNYLYLKVPLVKPDRMLAQLNTKTGFIFSRFFVWGLFLAAALGIWLVSQDWTRWLADFALIKTPQGIALTAAMIFFAKIIHEIGHGLAAKHYGCRVPRMGVALILLWPVLWTDTTHAWRLVDRRQRLIIDSAGVIAELALASLATILWALSPDGAVKSALHVLSGVTWIMTLAVNANPFMRFDGYYILADAVDIPNLQDRAFAHTKWWLRRHLLGLAEDPPERWSTGTARFLIIYALSCWIYRLILFTGIALLVYAYFFKALGLLLFAVEIWFFILRPIVNEARVWQRGIASVKSPAPTLRLLLAALAVLLVLAALPIHRVMSLPAYVRAPQEYALEAPVGAQLITLNVKNGQAVRKGDVLAVLDAPDLAAQADLSRAQTSALRQQYRQQALPGQTYDKAVQLRSQIAAKSAEVRAYAAGMSRLTLVAQADGIVRDIPPDMRVGDWLAAKEPIAILVRQGAQITAYVTEDQLHRLAPGQSARLLSQGRAKLGGVDFIVTRVDIRPVDVLPYPELAAEHGGDIPMVEGGATQRGRTVPAQQIFAVILEEASGPKTALLQSGPGRVLVTAQAHSPLLSFLRNILSVIIRESGF